MAAYTVRHAYRSTRDGVPYGPWESGDVVDLDPADAAWVNRDSPGALAEKRAQTEKPPPSETRPHRGGRDRRR